MVRRVPRHQIDAMIVVALATAPPLVKSRLRSKLPHEADWARQQLARTICDKIDNDSFMVIVTEMIATSTPYPRLGKWGVDEPAPAVVPAPPEPE
jgi:hypothetical protein